MDYIRTGIILKTENYTECVRFYKELIGLNSVEEKIEADFKMMAFDFGTAYLLVETGGIAKPEGKDVSRNPSVLRFDVDDVNIVMDHLKKNGIQADLYKFDWGNLVIAHDPDGNQIEFKGRPDD